MGSFWNARSPVTDNRARKRLNSSRKIYAGGCSALAAIVLMLGSRGLETAVANGDTRTITLHHIHTNEDITITFKRDGRYDEEALKKLNWFVRDWRKEEEFKMDPRLFDLVWEASREVGGDKAIHVVCGYRSPATNAMLRARSNGVAKFSQHTLGKAMDFFIPGASLEELRNVGLRLQRGGVGYYPTSGSPFVHLDVGNVRHWGPAIGEAEMARIMSGHTVHVAALSGDSAKRMGSSSKPALSAQKKSVPAVSGDDEDEVVAAKPAPVRAAAAPARVNTFSLASLDSKPAELGRPMNVAPVNVAPVRVAAVPAAPLPQARPGAKAVAQETTAGTVAWPVRGADNDRAPADVALAYATPLSGGSAMRPEFDGGYGDPPRAGSQAGRGPRQRDHRGEEDRRSHRVARRGRSSPRAGYPRGRAGQCSGRGARRHHRDHQDGRRECRHAL